MLRTAYLVHAVPIESRLTEERVEDVVDTYMALLVLGGNVSSMAPADIKTEQAEILEVYPAWPESQAFTREVQRSVLAVNSVTPAFSDGMLSFNESARIVEEIG